MQAEPLAPRARRLLAQMGIDVWRLRQVADADAPPMARAGLGADLAPESTRTAEAASGQALSARAATDVSTETRIPTGAGKASPEPARGPAVEPFTVLCFCGADALLLVEPVDSRAARRFAADLLAAVSGSWGGAIRQLAFEWPQRGIEQSAVAVARALDAFVRKQLADHEGSRVLVDARVAARLDTGTLPQDCLRIGSFDALMTDGKLKRALWRDIGQHRGR